MRNLLASPYRKCNAVGALAERRAFVNPTSADTRNNYRQPVMVTP